MPSVDVLVPNYQYGRFLSRSVESILEQDIDDLRILIIDNASTDNSVDIARAFAVRDPRIEVRARTANLGVHASISEGIDWAEADYFMLLCSDDFLPLGALKRAVSVMEQHPRTAFASGAYYELREANPPPTDPPGDPSWTIRTGDDFIADTCRRFVRAVSPLIRTRIQKQAGQYRGELPYTNDLEMLLRLACLGDVAWTPLVQAVQRIHHENMSQEIWKDPMLAIAADLAIFDSFFRHEGKNLPRAARLHADARRNIGEQAYWTGVSHLLRGQHQTGRKLMRTAFDLAPRTAVIPPLSHLARIDRPMHRAVGVLAQALGARRSRQPTLHGHG